MGVWSLEAELSQSRWTFDMRRFERLIILNDLLHAYGTLSTPAPDDFVSRKLVKAGDVSSEAQRHLL